MRYEVCASGSHLGFYDNKEDAEKRLEEARNSFLALVHPWDCFYIKEVK